MVTTEEVSCITTQTNRNSKGVFFDIFKRHLWVAKLDSHGYEKYMQVANTESRGYEQLFVSTGTKESNSRIIRGFALRQVANRKKTHF